MPQIETLVPDIENLILKGVLKSERVQHFSDNLARELSGVFNRGSRAPTLRMSSIMRPCERQLWYDINESDKAEAHSASTLFKFSYGNLLEELLLFLAEESGHTVTGRQDTLEIAGIIGHRDAVIDGVTVDTKSASTASFKKFKEGLTPEGDGFGYLGQLQSYVFAAKTDPLVTDKTRGAFLVCDKTLGHICLDIHTFDPARDVPGEFERKKELVNGPVPERGFQPEPYGQSGNMSLPFNCSYCAYKHHCHLGLRTFLYSNKPVFLTTVKLLPKVPELLADVEIDIE